VLNAIGDPAHFLGRYSSRSISALLPSGAAYARNAPTWQFSTRPAVRYTCGPPSRKAQPMATITITPRGPFSLAASGAFLEGFAPAR
jgi:hypothetical protein